MNHCDGNSLDLLCQKMVNYKIVSCDLSKILSSFVLSLPSHLSRAPSLTRHHIFCFTLRLTLYNPYLFSGG